jgi:bifunctional UDP-N-acetylglucosamine pyrophosphorylase / glucosamine-1-phosphate N-acetyltransferase
MKATAAIILAAGKGTRMKSGLLKVMHSLGGYPMISWPVRAALAVGSASTVIVIGYQGDKVREYFAGARDISFAMQAEQLGTGHAVACAAPYLMGSADQVLVLCGDVPLIRSATLQAMLSSHEASQATLTVLTARLENPHGYGRVVKGSEGGVLRIVEEKDATAEEKDIDEVNTGIYCVEAKFLFDSVLGLENDNVQGEYYLTDIVKKGADEGKLCQSFALTDVEEVMGVNDRVQLAAAGKILRRRINEKLMLSGVTIIDPETAYIEDGVEVGMDTLIHPNVHISGPSSIGTDCVIEPSVVIRGCRIGNGVIVKAGTVMSDSILHDSVTVGPMAHLRPGSELKDHVKIGNFVETKKVVMGEGSKASHLTYLGDAAIGTNVNIGCGTITCNYDGVKKHRTIIEDDVFVGSDVQFVAPVTIGRNSLVAAGTTVTRDVPPDSLAIARTQQVNKEGWKLRKKSSE